MGPNSPMVAYVPPKYHTIEGIMGPNSPMVAYVPPKYHTIEGIMGPNSPMVAYVPPKYHTIEGIMGPNSPVVAYVDLVGQIRLKPASLANLAWALSSAGAHESAALLLDVF